MPKKTHGLGRGLDSLFPGTEEWGTSIQEIPVGDLDTNPDQPRQTFDDESIAQLADSIRDQGVLQPLLVVPFNGGRYRIIAGERRYRASRLAGLETLPCIVKDIDVVRQMEIALIENLQREDLNPLEAAKGIQALMKQCGYTQEKVSTRLGKSRPAVANLLRLLTLPDSVKQMLVEGKLSAGHARALVTVEPRRQMQLANLTVQQGWSVRQLERICAQPVKEDVKKPRRARDAQISELESMARELFGTRVKLDGTTDSGRITLFYYNADDLQRIWDVLEMARDGQ